MDNNQFIPQGKNSSKKVLSLIGLGCSCFGCFLTLLFSIITCSRGKAVVKKTFFKAIYKGKYKDAKFGTSLFIIFVIIGLIISIAGVVLSILSMEKNTKMSAIVLVSLIVGGFSILYGVMSNATICGYNCVINCEIDKELDD